MPDDDYDRLLREVEAALAQPEPTTGRPAPAPPGPAAVEPSEAGAPAKAGRDGAVQRVRAGLPWSVAVGAGCAVVAGTVFAIVPFVDGLSGALAAFCTGFAVSAAGRVRRRR